MDKYFGIDIAKERFESFNDGSPRLTVQNSKLPIKAFLRALPKAAVLAIEATGGYGKLLADMAHKAGFTVSERGR